MKRAEIKKLVDNIKACEACRSYSYFPKLCGDCCNLMAKTNGGAEVPCNVGLCLTWFEKAEPGKECSPDIKCEYAETNGNCDSCGTMDGRGIEEINCYASTCDACGEQTMHEELEMNEENQLGTCQECLKKGLKA